MNLKFTLLSILALSTFQVDSVFANAYRINLNYSDDTDDGGTLSGFFEINTSLDTGNEIQSDLGKISIPNWITAIDLTAVESGVSTNKTLSDFSHVKWNLKTANINNFDITSDFVAQMDGFGFQSTDDAFFVGNDTFIQQFGSELEFALNSTTSTPGEIPLLGLGALLMYYKKIKNKSYKL